MFYISFFFFNDTATTEIYTLSLHDALPICGAQELIDQVAVAAVDFHAIETGAHRIGRAPAEVADHVLDVLCAQCARHGDRKSTRLNSSHSQISYAVFCLKKKKKHNKRDS